MPATLPNVYCSPQDVYDYLGTDATQLRLDDRNQATGQSVMLSSAAAVGDTTLNIDALQYGLLRGSKLLFSDAGMTTPVEVTLTAVALAAATTLSVSALTTAINNTAVARDDGVNVWLAGQILKSCQFATGTIQRYCLNRYDDSQLVNSWSVNDWAIKIAGHRLATRCFRAAPEQIQKAYEQTLEELKEVKSGEICLDNCAPRTSETPFLSNVTVDPRYTITKARVEVQISDPGPTQYPQYVDWSSVWLLEI